MSNPERNPCAQELWEKFEFDLSAELLKYPLSLINSRDPLSQALGSKSLAALLEELEPTEQRDTVRLLFRCAPARLGGRR